MAKDPAVLFYTADFMIGTNTLSNEQVGIYIRMLCHQHQNGRFKREHMAIICGLVDEEVLQKFTKDKDENYYNVRMEEEANKRKNFCNSRKTNAQKGKECQRKKPKAYADHMVNENVNVNEDINNNILTINSSIGDDEMKKPKPPKSYEEVLQYAEQWNRKDLALKFWEHFEAGEWYDTEGKPVLNWKQKFVTWKNRNEKPAEKKGITVAEAWEKCK